MGTISKTGEGEEGRTKIVEQVNKTKYNICIYWNIIKYLLTVNTL